MSRFDEAAKEWDNKSKRVQIAKSVIQNILQNVSVKERVILDYGCGTGLLAYGISEDAKKVIGMDSSHGMLEVFKQKNKNLHFDNVTCQYHDADDMDLGVCLYDGIISSMTLHHIKDTQSFLHHCYASLKKGGFVAIADLDKEDGSFHSDNTGVCHFGFSLKQIQQLYTDAGFKVQFLQNIHDVQKENKTYPVFLAIGVKE